jgi:hypothetical protein
VRCRAEWDSIAILLCGDLVADRPEFGWRAVVNDPARPSLQRAGLVKVPHHGGAGAHDPAMWAKLVTAEPWLLVAPYWRSGLPRSTDIERLGRLGAEVWQAAPSRRWIKDAEGNDVALPSETGLVRARHRLSAPSWVVRCRRPAFRAVPREPAGDESHLLIW